MDNKTILSTFVDNYNSFCPTEAELTEFTTLDSVSASKFASKFKLSFKENNYSEKEKLVVNFINSVVPAKASSGLAVPFSFFDFIRDYQNIPNYFWVGNCADDKILVNKETDEVISYNDDAENISYFLSPNFKDFLAIILILAENGRLSFLNLSHTKDKFWKEKICTIVQDDKYFHFYKFSYTN